jgi:hypothetical protein
VLLRQLAHGSDYLAMLFQGAMREIESSTVHSRSD